MKEWIKEIFEVIVLPPLVIGGFLFAVSAISSMSSHPAEEMTVGDFLEYHSVEEIVEYLEDEGYIEYDEIAEYLNERGDTLFVAEAFNKEFDGEYFFISWDDAAYMVDGAYALGYYFGATEEKDPILNDAIQAGDLRTIYEYTAGALSPGDFLD